MKYTKYLSSHNFPIDKSDADFSEGDTCPYFPEGES